MPIFSKICCGFVLLFALWMTGDVVACPTCADGMLNDENSAVLIRGYFWSILFMMSMPFAVFGGIVTYLYMLVRRARLDALTDQTMANS